MWSQVSESDVRETDVPSHTRLIYRRHRSQPRTVKRKLEYTAKAPFTRGIAEVFGVSSRNSSATCDAEESHDAGSISTVRIGGLTTNNISFANIAGKMR